jgi:malonyl CoA-acyl carrier protein transacylase
MVADGITSFTEVGGSGKVLSGLIKKVYKEAETVTL